MLQVVVAALGLASLSKMQEPQPGLSPSGVPSAKVWSSRVDWPVAEQKEIIGLGGDDGGKLRDVFIFLSTRYE